MKWLAIPLVFLWSFAEATLFFLAPEFLICVIAVGLSGKRTGIAILSGLCGVFLGLAVMYFWGMRDIAGAVPVMNDTLGMSAQSILDVRSGFLGDWPAAVFKGVLFGGSTKLFAVEAGNLGIPFMSLCVVALAAKTVRFASVAVLATVLAGALNGALVRLFSEDVSVVLTRRLLTVVVLGVWLVFYGVYFGLIGAGTAATY